MTTLWQLGNANNGAGRNANIDHSHTTNNASTIVGELCGSNEWEGEMIDE